MERLDNYVELLSKDIQSKGSAELLKRRLDDITKQLERAKNRIL